MISLPDKVFVEMGGALSSLAVMEQITDGGKLGETKLGRRAKNCNELPVPDSPVPSRAG